MSTENIINKINEAQHDMLELIQQFKDFVETAPKDVIFEYYDGRRTILPNASKVISQYQSVTDELVNRISNLENVNISDDILEISYSEDFVAIQEGTLFDNPNNYEYLLTANNFKSNVFIDNDQAGTYNFILPPASSMTVGTRLRILLIGTTNIASFSFAITGSTDGENWPEDILVSGLLGPEYGLWINSLRGYADLQVVSSGGSNIWMYLNGTDEAQWSGPINM